MVHHNPCFNLFILHNNQGSERKKRQTTYFYVYYLTVFVKDS